MQKTVERSLHPSGFPALFTGFQEYFAIEGLVSESGSFAVTATRFSSGQRIKSSALSELASQLEISNKCSLKLPTAAEAAQSTRLQMPCRARWWEETMTIRKMIAAGALIPALLLWGPATAQTPESTDPIKIVRTIGRVSSFSRTSLEICSRRRATTSNMCLPILSCSIRPR